jgi:sugar phosphate isomerase/epimerase
MAERHDLLVGLQGIPTMHPTNPDQIAKPENYEEGVAPSKNFRITIDIGDAVGGGYDALKFVQDHHERIFQLFLKDRTKAGVSVPWGEGDTPIAAILKLIREQRWPIRGYIDNDYKSTLSRAEDVKRSFAYAKRVLG